LRPLADPAATNRTTATHRHSHREGNGNQFMKSCSNCFYGSPAFVRNTFCLHDHELKHDDFCCDEYQARDAGSSAVPEPLPAVPLVESVPEPELLRAVRRPCFSFRASLKQFLKINRVGVVNIARMRPDLFRHSTTNQERNK
jgi:hypothetical protein